jgi:hypothetical protein
VAQFLLPILIIQAKKAIFPQHGDVPHPLGGARPNFLAWQYQVGVAGGFRGCSFKAACVCLLTAKFFQNVDAGDEIGFGAILGPL